MLPLQGGACLDLLCHGPCYWCYVCNRNALFSSGPVTGVMYVLRVSQPRSPSTLRMQVEQGGIIDC